MKWTSTFKGGGIGPEWKRDVTSDLGAPIDEAGQRYVIGAPGVPSEVGGERKA